MINNVDINKISGIGNSQYFLENYSNYIDNNKKSSLLVIDLTGFKNINDTFGHSIGDEYIIFFSEILMKTFDNSIVSRLHGDEFAVLTSHSDVEIAKLLKKCDELIKKEVQKRIPVYFKFNCGVSKSTDNYEESFNKADYMMYYAKKNGKILQFYDEDIWKEKLENEKFTISLIENTISGNLSYKYIQLFDGSKIPTGIIQIYTRGDNYTKLFSSSLYDWLRTNNKINDFDTNNIVHLLKNFIDSNKVKRILFVDYNTLNNSDFFIKTIMDKYGNEDLSNIIIGIDLSNFNTLRYDRLIKNVKCLKDLGFSILLDKYNTNLPDCLWEIIEPEFTIISENFWKKSLQNDKTKHMLKNKLELFDYYQHPTIPIFTCIESEEEMEFLKEISNKTSLYSGNYLSEEKKLILK